MSPDRVRVPAVCPVCSREFYPWKSYRPRQLPPACTVKCARQLTGQTQKGRPVVAAIAGRRVQAAQRLTQVIGVEFDVLSERERQIFSRAYRLGYHKGYNATWQKRIA